MEDHVKDLTHSRASRQVLFESAIQAKLNLLQNPPIKSVLNRPASTLNTRLYPTHAFSAVIGVAQIPTPFCPVVFGCDLALASSQPICVLYLYLGA